MNIEIKNLYEAFQSKIDKSKWIKWKFSDLVHNVNEKVTPKNSGLEHYIGLEHLDSGSLKIRRFGKTSSIEGDKLKIYKGDLIFAKRNAYLKRVAIAEFDAVASAHSLVLRAKSENVLPEFLPFFLLSETFWEKAIEISVGSLSPTINWGTIAKQEFLLPPKEQQAELAELLWAMDEVIEKDLAVLAALDEYKQSFVFTSFKKANEVRKVSELGEVVTGSTPSTENENFWGGNIPFVSPAEIDDSSYINNYLRYLTDEGAKKARRIPANSVLTVCIGSTIGKVGINKVDCFSNQQINALIPKKQYSSIFILYLLRFYKHKILARTGATAVPM